ncbi:hydroxyacid-oxoacid transhydrogenase, mitochondrial-like isoform X2 [Pomacea canaliculata]|uniref:hydroxyacid-oxoacid transhydrogenase, mitochondrial-like isoform X2 n=1 Tax=Pomacea canaliculata TaxID=400727 RepID=UPI000D7321C9|nr:hydroxyacid-oxoacid transhydrogenase, mitochondrial-like isoform X2 [Pomacea canaliculata]
MSSLLRAFCGYHRISTKWKGLVPSSYQFIQNGLVSTYNQSDKTDYAYEMACSNIRYGKGVTQEVGLDCLNFKARNVCVMTDSKLAKMDPVRVALESLEQHKVPYQLYDKVRVEPSDQSFKNAVQFALDGNFDVFLAIGGGSVMDTCKAANLYSSNPSAEFLDYVNAPIGRGRPVTHTVKPLIAVSTTAGTGSETTGTAVFDFLALRSKTGISSRALRPTLGILDPLHLRTVPERVTAYTGIDVLCHAIESFTALPYYERQPRPDNPIARPAYQGSNPISDVWSRHALTITSKFLKRAVYNPDDEEARSQMLLASCFAGIGFGNAGCHLCHGMSYPISGLVKTFTSKDYDLDHPMVPHGLSVIITAPAVFTFTASACPERHLEAATCLGADVRNVKREDAGKFLADVLRKIMLDIEVPNGLKELGYTSTDIPELVKGTLPQHRVTKLSPRPASEEDFAAMFESSLTVY